MAETAFEVVLAVALLLVALTFWLLVLRRWREAGGAVLALATTVPMIRLSLAGDFRPSAVLICAAGLLAGIAVALAKPHQR